MGYYGCGFPITCLLGEALRTKKEIVVVTDREADNSSEGESDNENVLDPDRVAESSFVAESVQTLSQWGHCSRHGRLK